MIKPETVQKIFVAWFMILTFMASINFYENVRDNETRKMVEKSEAERIIRYEKSIQEHEDFRKNDKEAQSEIQYLKGRIDEWEKLHASPK